MSRRVLDYELRRDMGRGPPQSNLTIRCRFCEACKKSVRRDRSEVRIDLGNLELAIHFIDNSLVIVIFTGVEVQKRPAERSDSDQGIVNQ